MPILRVCECARKRLEEHGGCVSSEWTPVPGRPGTVAIGQHHFPPIGAISQSVPCRRGERAPYAIYPSDLIAAQGKSPVV